MNQVLWKIWARCSSSQEHKHRSATSFSDQNVPLLSSRMSDNKSNPKLGEVAAVRSTSEDSGFEEFSEPKKAPWWSYIWDYDPTRTLRERKFVQKLDFSLLTILSLGYFIKNLDQTNISNAYVSGMKEALQMNANQLNLIDVAWTSGYVVGQLPSQFILTKV